MPAGSDDALNPTTTTKRGDGGQAHGEEVLLARGAGVVSTRPEVETPQQQPRRKQGILHGGRVVPGDDAGIDTIGPRLGFPGPSRR